MEVRPFALVLCAWGAVIACSGAMVADPYRAVDATWKRHVAKGRDYWLLLQPAVVGLKGLENEPFVVDSGTSEVPMDFTKKTANPWGYATPDDVYYPDGIRGEAKLRERLLRAPFTVYSGVNEDSVRTLSLRPENVDTSGYDRLFDRYPETFLGPYFNEWDAGILHRLHRYSSDGYRDFAQMAKLPCNRAEMRENFHRCWRQAQIRLGKRFFGLSGSTSFEHWACEWGGSISCVETTGAPERPMRNILMFARSAARQFEVPFYCYTAYFRHAYNPSSLPGRMGPEAGIEVSLAWREHLLSYYMGANFQDFESFPYGHCRKRADGLHELTANGLELRDLHSWTRSEKGVRGECYTPILFLLDRNHGYDQLNETGLYDGYGPFKGSYLPSDADFYTDWAMKAISPVYNVLRGETCPDKSACLRNSPLGDIFDVFIANSDVPGRELRDDQLAKYPVVMVLGDILWTASLANRIKRYVAEGGTFVVTAGQIAPFAGDAAFLGKKFVSGDCRKDDIVVNDYGNGKVVLIANPFMHQEKQPWKVPQAMKDLLAELQDETVPFKVSGDCEFLYNRMPDGSWKAILVNNAGTFKEGYEPNRPADLKWARVATLELPVEAEAEEVLEGVTPALSRKNDRKFLSYTIPSGRVLVVNVGGVKTPAPMEKKPFAVDPIAGFADQVYRPHPVFDKYLKNAAEHRYVQKAPATILDWRNPTGGASAVTTNVIVSAKYHVPNCVFEIEAKADLADSVKPKGDHQGALFYAGDMLGVAIDRDNRWYCYALYGSTAYRIRGPKASGEWEKIKVVFNRGEVRFYFNGRECVDPQKGRMTFPQCECRDGFYERIVLDIGEMHHGWNNYFPGVVRAFRMTTSADGVREFP